MAEPTPQVHPQTPWVWASAPEAVDPGSPWPRRAARARRALAGWRPAAAAALALAEPVVRTIAIAPAPGWAIVAGAILLALAVLARIPEERSVVRLAVVAAAALACWPPGGLLVGIAAALSLVLAEWAVSDRRPHVRLPAADAHALPLVALLVWLAARQGTVVTARAAPLALLLGAIGVTFAAGLDRRATSARGRPSHAERALHRVRHLFTTVMWPFALAVGRWAARVTSVLLFGALAVPAVLAPWLVQRALLLDPLGGHRTRGTRWIERRRSAPRPEAPWTLDQAASPARPFRKVRTVVAVAASLVAMTLWVAREAAMTDFGTPPSPAAYADAPWWPDYATEMEFIGVPGLMWNPYDFQRVHDVDMQYIDVRDGERTTWQPPACGSCPTIEVWVYGGSTTFGFGQRNEHTIPSELARIAWERGYRLEVHNRGVTGDVHWEEAHRFAWEVTGPEAPDVVIFYDGVNDLASARLRDRIGNNDNDQPVSLALEEWRQDYGPSWVARNLRPYETPEGATILEPDRADRLPGPELVVRALRDYERSRLVSRAAAEASGVEAVWFWQPERRSRPAIEGEEREGPEVEAADRAQLEQARTLLAEDVIDLSDALDGSDEPIFYDNVHHNELGARLIAAAMFEQLEPTLTRLAEETGS